MQSVKGEYRMLVWKQGEAKNSVMDRLLIWKTLLDGEGSQRIHISENQKEQTIKASISRADLIHLFAYAIHRTPKFVPYQYGETYSYLIYGWVPRLFWPDKPTAQAANQFFGVAYDLQDENSISSTSIGLPHLVEAFINFGNLGVIFIMMLLGMFYATLDRLFNHPDAGGGGIAIYATFLMNFMNIETATGRYLWGRCPRASSIFYFLLRTMRNKRTRVRLKIAHITPSFYPALVYGGPTESVYQLCQRGSGQSVAEVRVLTTNANGKAENSGCPDQCGDNPEAALHRPVLFPSFPRVRFLDVLPASLWLCRLGRM